MKVSTANRPTAKAEHKWTPYERQLIDDEIRQALYKQHIQLQQRKMCEWVNNFRDAGKKDFMQAFAEQYGDQVEQAKKDQWVAEFRAEAQQQVNEMVKERQKEIAEEAERLTLELQLVTVYILHDLFGFGEGRCKKYLRASWENSLAVKRRYQTDDEGMRWYYAERLREDGIDVHKWSDEAKREAMREDAQQPLPQTARQADVEARRWARMAKTK